MMSDMAAAAAAGKPHTAIMTCPFPPSMFISDAFAEGPDAALVEKPKVAVAAPPKPADAVQPTPAIKAPAAKAPCPELASGPSISPVTEAAAKKDTPPDQPGTGGQSVKGSTSGPKRGKNALGSGDKGKPCR